MNKLPLLFNFIVTIEYLSLVAAIFLLHNKHIGKWRLFIPMLIIIVFAETLGWYFRYFLRQSNAWIFNLNMIITICFVLWMLSNAPMPTAVQKIIRILAGIFVVEAIINLLLGEGFWRYNEHTETIGNIIQVIACCTLLYYFIKIEAYNNFLTSEYFWLANGILFSAMGGAILYRFPIALANVQKHTGINIFGILNNMLNALLYGSLIIAFICRQKNTKSLAAS